MATEPMPTAPIRVLVVDDSAVARAVIERILASHPDIALVGQAAGAEQAIRLLGEVETDVILLDLEMPRRGGLQALPDLLGRARRARVLVVSSACGAGADATVHALRLGAADTLLKPDGLLRASEFGAVLVERIRRLGATEGAVPAVALAAPSAFEAVPEIVGIAASTGGVHAAAELLAALPPAFAAPLLVTQHLPATFIPHFAGQLAEASGRPARVAEPGMQPRPGEILLAPGDRHLTLFQVNDAVHVRLEEGRSASGHLPSADPMFRSLGEVYGPRAVGVVLSGMGRDGAEGAAALVSAGGRVAVQDQSSSVIWGMPGTVARRGLARAVLPPAELAAWLANGVEREHVTWN